jgi:hypothetical protein
MGPDNLEDGLTNKLENRLPYYKNAKSSFKYNIALETDIINYLKS